MCPGKADEKMRLDMLLVRLGFFETREKARRSIMAREVSVNGMVEDKPGTMVAISSQVEVRALSDRYVSRGGIKLEGALIDLDIDVRDKVAIDIGASTGGFTDCLLRHGARKVYAVDVGKGQLIWKLREDPRVVTLEGVNIRHASPDIFPEKADIITVDVSFISVTKFLDLLREFVKPSGQILILIKPQFEAGREKVGKGGVVKDPRVHREVINSIIDFALSHGFGYRGLTYSKIKGPKGNIEFFLLLGPKPEEDGTTSRDELQAQISEVVAKAQVGAFS
ncbi:MAG: TlyA family RNA methyltransferase [Firmicutes bacterium]|nr:TlyA family RNA methyltransferase [Bacillota bacterium]